MPIMKMGHWLSLVCCALGLLCDHGAHALTTVISVKLYGEECFSFLTGKDWEKDIKANPRYIYGGYELLSHSSDEAPPIQVYIAPHDFDRFLYKSKRTQAEGQFDIKIESNQKYWFCVSNNPRRKMKDDDDEYEISESDDEEDLTAKIGFDLELVTHDDFDYVDDKGNPLPKRFDSGISEAHAKAKEKSEEWYDLSGRLERKINSMKKHFDHLRVSEMDHRAVTEKSFSSVMTWTLAEALTVTAVALGQIFYFRRYIESKRQKWNY